MNSTQALVKHRNRNKIKNTMLYCMMIPGLAYLVINNYLPMIGLVVAFKNYNYRGGIFGSPWCGADNFVYLFKTDSAYLITRNTLLFNLSFIALTTLVAVTMAILLNEINSKRYIKGYQTTILMPYLISMIIASYIVFALLSSDNGLFNKSILPAFGIEPIRWYSEPRYWPAILIITYLWKNFGFYTVIYYASVIAIDTDYYEAATLDGASKMRQIVSITLPIIRPVIISMVLLSIGRIFYSDFGLFYQVPRDSGALYSVTNTIDTYVYRALINLGDVGMSSAACVYQSIVGLLMVVGANALVRKVDPESAMF